MNGGYAEEGSIMLDDANKERVLKTLRELGLMAGDLPPAPQGPVI